MSLNTGAFGEGFPYTNFHELNMDWIIKIAKDFLDQYTHIQEIIEQGKEDIQTLTEEGITEIGDLTATGLQQLQDKADNLESLLQQWYDTHSEDIPNQLADALADLNDWYTEHIRFLNTYVEQSIIDFNTHAEQKAVQTIASIPDDYTELANKVLKLNQTVKPASYDEQGTFTVTNGSDVATGIGTTPGHIYGVFASSDYSQLYIYNAPNIQSAARRYFNSKGQVFFTANSTYIFISGVGTHTTSIRVIDLTAHGLTQHDMEFATYFTLASESAFGELNYDMKIIDGILKPAYAKYQGNFTITNGGDVATNFHTTSQHLYGVFASSNYTDITEIYVYNAVGIQSATKHYFNNKGQTFFTANSTYIFLAGDRSLSASVSLRVVDLTELNLSQTDLANATYTSLANPSFYGKFSEDGHLIGKKIVFYGDSITAQGTFPPLVSTYYGMTYVNAGVGGSTIIYRTDSDMSSDTRINGLPSDADIVFIMGGTNDWGKTQIESGPVTYTNGFDRTKFKGALAYIIQHIQAQCPNAKIIIGTLIGGRNETRSTADPVTQYLPEKDQYGQSDYDFRNAEIEVASTLNVDVCDCWSCGINGNNAFSTITDTVHPTTLGATMIANYIIGHLRGVQI